MNHRGFWDPLLALLDRQVEAELLSPRSRALPIVVGDVVGALASVAAAFAAPRTDGAATDFSTMG